MVTDAIGFLHIAPLRESQGPQGVRKSKLLQTRFAPRESMDFALHKIWPKTTRTSRLAVAQIDPLCPIHVDGRLTQFVPVPARQVEFSHLRQ
jgi:hypothetical protein